MHSVVEITTFTRRRRQVDLAGRDKTAAERRQAYREALRPEGEVEEALVDAMSAIQSRLRELDFPFYPDREEEIVRNLFYATMTALRKLQKLRAESPGPQGPRKAA